MLTCTAKSGHSLWKDSGQLREEDLGIWRRQPEKMSEGIISDLVPEKHKRKPCKALSGLLHLLLVTQLT